MKNSKLIRLRIRARVGEIADLLKEAKVNGEPVINKDVIRMYYDMAVNRERHRILTRMRRDRRANSKSWRVANRKRYNDYQRNYYSKTRHGEGDHSAGPL